MKAYKENNSPGSQGNKYVFPEDFFAGLEGLDWESMDPHYPLNRMSSFRFKSDRSGRRKVKKDEWS